LKKHLAQKITDWQPRALGIEESCTVRFALFLDITKSDDLEDEVTIENAGVDGHSCFWVLPTAPVLHYMAANLCRWMLLYKALPPENLPAERITKSCGTAYYSTKMMIENVASILNLCSGIPVESHPTAWRKRWIESDPDRVIEDNPDVEAFGDRWGLRLGMIVQRYGTAWRPLEYMNWRVSPPTFHDEWTRRLLE
jgi:hypothetical protein